ncbi:MAG: acyl carrier protein [Solirubrobacteraceae bacterium]
MTDAGESVRDFLISEHYWQGARGELRDDLPLIGDRVIDSMGLLRLVAWLEEQFGVKIDDTDVVPANFGTIEAIAALVRSKRAA